MSKTFAKVMAAVLALVLLFTVPGLVGCGENGGEGKVQIRIGVLTDFTGPASSAVKPTITSFMDCFKLAQEKGEFPEGVEIKWFTYDQRTDYSRTPPGYKWLLGQGVAFMNIISPTDRSILANKFIDDQMLVTGSSLDEGSPAHEWIYNEYGSNGHEVEAAVQFITDTWDYDGMGRVPKIGHQSWVISSGEFHQMGFERMMAWPEYADKFEFVGWERAPMGTATWTTEIQKFMDCDYIFFSTVGSMTSTFIREARNRGYTGALISGTNAFPGYWDMVTDVVSGDKLQNCYFLQWNPWWSADIPAINEAKEAIDKYHADEKEALERNSGPLSGYFMGKFTLEGLKNAIEAVGAENLTGAAIRDALKALNMTLEGFPEPWRMYQDYYAVQRQMLTFKYNPSINNWENTGHGWIIPHSLKDLQPLA